MPAVAGRFVLLSAREVGFEAGAYDRARELVIDPVLVYSTYLGGADSDGGGEAGANLERPGLSTGHCPRPRPG